MAFLDFLKPKQNGHAPTIDVLEGKLSELHESRERSASFLATIEERRAKLLIDDADPAKIIALDAEADAARISIEKGELFEQEILARMAVLHGAQAETAWRDAYDRMHRSALEYAESLRASLAALYRLRGATDQLSVFGIGMRRPEPGPIILGSEILERWLRDVEQNHDFELSRRERQARE
jgi:hypothetical protein